jgi:uncharacterized protein involved in tellurium resistance
MKHIIYKMTCVRASQIIYKGITNDSFLLNVAKLINKNSDTYIEQRQIIEYYFGEHKNGDIISTINTLLQKEDELCENGCNLLYKMSNHKCMHYILIKTFYDTQIISKILNIYNYTECHKYIIKALDNMIDSIKEKPDYIETEQLVKKIRK